MVGIVPSGVDALSLIRKEMPDLITLDVMMPKMSGYDVCKIIKSDARFNKIPIVMISAKITQKDIKAGRELGADSYFTKPFDNKELLEAVQKLLPAVSD